MALQLLYFSVAVSTKTSLLLLYYRIFGVIRWFRWLLVAVWCVVLLYFVVSVPVAIFQCRPVAFYWNKSIKNGSCINRYQFYRWNGVANLLLDFIIWSLTMPVIWHLGLNTRQKLSLSAVFLLGLLSVSLQIWLFREITCLANSFGSACVASVIRVVAFDWVNYNDVTYTIGPGGIWTTVEQSVGIICASLPTTRPLFDRLLHSIKHASGHNPRPHVASHATLIPVAHCPSITAVGGTTDKARGEFSSSSEENMIGCSAVTAYASQSPSDDLLVVPERIVRQHKIEQHVEIR